MRSERGCARRLLGGLFLWQIACQTMAPPTRRATPDFLLTLPRMSEAEAVQGRQDSVNENDGLMSSVARETGGSSEMAD